MRLLDFVVALCFVILLVPTEAEPPIEPCFIDDDDAILFPKETIQFTLKIDSVTKRREKCKNEAIEQLWDILEDRLRESGRKGGGGEDFGEKIRFTNVVQTSKKRTRVIRWEGRATCPFCFEKEKSLRPNFLMLFQRRVTHRINGALKEITMDKEQEKTTRMCLGNFKATFQIEGATVLAPFPDKLAPTGITGILPIVSPDKPPQVGGGIGVPRPGVPKPNPGGRKPKPKPKRGIRKPKPKPGGPIRGITGGGNFSSNRSPSGGGTSIGISKPLVPRPSVSKPNPDLGGGGGRESLRGGGIATEEPPSLATKTPPSGEEKNSDSDLLGSEFSITLTTMNSNADIDKCSPSFKKEINKHIELGVKKYGKEYAEGNSVDLGSLDVDTEPGRRLSLERQHHRQLRRMKFVWTGWTGCRWCNEDDSDGGGISTSGLTPVEKLQAYISSKLTNDIRQLAKDRTKAIQKMSCIGSGNHDIIVHINFGTKNAGSSNQISSNRVGIGGAGIGGTGFGGTSVGSGGFRPMGLITNGGGGTKSGDSISTDSSGGFGYRVVTPGTNVVTMTQVRRGNGPIYKLPFEIVFDVLGVDETCDAQTQGRIDTVIVRTLQRYERKHPNYLDLHFSSKGRRRHLVETTSAHRILYRFVWSGWSGCHLCNPDDSDGRDKRVRTHGIGNDSVPISDPIIMPPDGRPTPAPTPAPTPSPTKSPLPVKELAEVELDVSRGLTIVLNSFAAQETAKLGGKASCMGLGNDNVLATFQFKID